MVPFGPSRARRATPIFFGTELRAPVLGASWPAPIQDGGWQVSRDCGWSQCAAMVSARGLPRKKGST